MDTQAILLQLRMERDRLDQAIRALQGSSGRAGSTSRGHRSAPKRHGGITAAGRKKLSQMMKARWAARRKAAAKKAPSKKKPVPAVATAKKE
jgi:hypothetical protein